MINNSTKYIQDVWRVKFLNQKPTCKPEMGNQKAYTYKINFRRKKYLIASSYVPEYLQTFRMKF